MDSEHHLLALMLFFELMKERFADRDDVFVGADLACYFSARQVKNKDFRAPDGIVVLGVEPRERRGWVAWEEDGRLPDLVVEHMSPSTRAADLGRKRQIYDEVWKVREYYAFDLKTGALHAFHRVDNQLVPAPRDAEDHVFSPILGVRVGVSKAGWGRHPGPFLRLFEQDGAPIPAADERAAAESARAAAATARADALEAELRALKARLGEG
jgi:Uma2 family endonuclease